MAGTTLGWGLTILGTVSDHPWNGGWTSCADGLQSWWGRMTILGLVFDHPGHGGCPSFRWWVTIHGMLGDQPWDGGWPSQGLWVRSWFCELSLCSKSQVCSVLLSGRFWWGFLFLFFLLFLFLWQGETKSTPSLGFWLRLEFDNIKF